MIIPITPTITHFEIDRSRILLTDEEMKDEDALMEYLQLYHIPEYFIISKK